MGEFISLVLHYAGQPGVGGHLRDGYTELAHRLAQQTYPAFNPLALDAARLRAQVLDERGQHSDAAKLWGHLIALYQITHKPDREQQARIAHALDLHRIGTCGEALNQISDAWMHARRPGQPRQDGDKELQLYLAMLAACGQHDDRDALHAEAAALATASGQDPDVRCRSRRAVTVQADHAEISRVQQAGEHRRVCAYQTPPRRRTR